VPRPLLAPATFVALVLLASACNRNPTTERTSNSTSAASSADVSRATTTATPAADAPLSLTAAAYLSDFTSSAEAAAKYRGRAIAVSGPIESLTADDAGLAYVLTAPNGGLTCRFADPAVWKKALPGQTLTLRGRLSADNPPALDQCTVVSVTGPRPPEFTASDLAANPPKSTGHVVVTAKIEDVEEGRITTAGGETTVRAKLVFGPPGSPRKLTGRVHQSFLQPTSPLTTGTTVTVVARPAVGEKGIELVGAVVVEVR